MINDSTSHPKGGKTIMTKNAVTPVADDATEDDEPTEPTYSAKDLAVAAGTDSKSFRRWLRDFTNERAADNGGRWVFSEDRKAALLDAYAKRNDAPAEEAEELTESE